MVIAVDTTKFNDNDAEDDSLYFYWLLIHMASQHTDDHFIFFSDGRNNRHVSFSENIEFVEVKPKVRNKLSFKWWYDVKLPKAAKKYKAEVIICPSGTVSLSTKIPQVLVINDFTVALKKSGLPYLSKSRFEASLKKARLIITTTNVVAQHLVDRLQIVPEKVFQIKGACNEIFEPVQWKEREKIKKEYSDGCEYFISKCYNELQLLLTLKSFSIFKKWQKSNMKMVLINRMSNEVVISRLATYKYKDDVILINRESSQTNRMLLSAAYAIIYTNEVQQFAVQILQAMSFGVPVIIAGNEAAMELGGEASLIASENPQALAEHLKLVYKNEAKRNQMIASGFVQANSFNLEESAEKLYEIIRASVSK